MLSSISGKLPKNNLKGLRQKKLVAAKKCFVHRDILPRNGVFGIMSRVE
jgi:hypothetical protein